MTHEEDISAQEQEQEKHVIRRDRVVVTKVTEQELSQIKSTAFALAIIRPPPLFLGLLSLPDNCSPPVRTARSRRHGS